MKLLTFKVFIKGKFQLLSNNCLLVFARSYFKQNNSKKNKWHISLFFFSLDFDALSVAS
jgi:hypothetical protein